MNMKIVTQSYTGGEPARRLTERAMRRAEALTKEYGYLVPNGWRMIVIERDYAEEAPRMMLDLQARDGGGEYAAAKVETLKTFPGWMATKPIGGDDLLEMVVRATEGKGKGPADQTVLAEIRQYDDPNQMPDRLWEWLRDECQLAPCYGGIRVPYTETVLKGVNPEEGKGEILIAFSGASQEQDLMFAVGMLRGLMAAQREEFLATYRDYELDALKDLPAVRLWLEIFGLRD